MRPLLEGILSKVRGTDPQAGPGATPLAPAPADTELLLKLPVLQ
jgi:hypothetical protein